MKKVWKRVLIGVSVAAAFVGGWAASGAVGGLMPPVNPILEQDPSQYGEDENAVLDASEVFWTAMEEADEAGMREICDPGCTFVHIGMTCKLDEEIRFYTDGIFVPTKLEFHGKSVEVFEDTAIVITDCNYALRLGGMSTEHHFAVTEVFVRQNEGWKMVQFSFTALSN